MSVIYVLIAILVLYGDLTKRVLSPEVSLAALYGSAGALLVLMAVVGRGIASRPRPDGATQLVKFFSMFLIVVYVFLSFGSVIGSGNMRGFVHAMYVGLPLAYLIVVQQCGRRFDLMKLARVFLVLALPMNVVGAVQYFVNPHFMLALEYSGPDGGIIEKTFLTPGTFSRFPSVFSSADRYSAMALFQVYFAFLLARLNPRRDWRQAAWVGFNLVTGGYALLIAGARSRILIALGAVGLTAAVAALRRPRTLRLGRTWTAARVAVIAMLLGAAGYLLAGTASRDDQAHGIFPVIALLHETAQEGEIKDRVESAVDSSITPSEATAFGNGLGTIGSGGKPGEFGIRSMWYESGLVGGGFLLLGFLGLVILLARFTWRAVVSQPPLDVLVCAVPLLLLVFALLAGLTSTFELSSGVLFGACVGWISQPAGTNCSLSEARLGQAS